MGIPWEWELVNNWEREWEGRGITVYGNGPYSHENKFPSADAVMSDDFW